MMTLLNEQLMVAGAGSLNWNAPCTYTELLQWGVDAICPDYINVTPPDFNSMT